MRLACAVAAVALTTASRLHLLVSASQSLHLFLSSTGRAWSCAQARQSKPLHMTLQLHHRLCNCAVCHMLLMLNCDVWMYVFLFAGVRHARGALKTSMTPGQLLQTLQTLLQQPSESHASPKAGPVLTVTGLTRPSGPASGATWAGGWAVSAACWASAMQCWPTTTPVC